MRTMGKGLVELQSPQGFAAETTSAAAILASSHMGFGLSTTQVCSGSVIGSGVGRNLSMVRWGTARRMVYGWLLTLPAAALFGAVGCAIALTGPVGVVIVLLALLCRNGHDRRDLPPHRGEPAQRQRLPRCHGQIRQGHGRDDAGHGCHRCSDHCSFNRGRGRADDIGHLDNRRRAGDRRHLADHHRAIDGTARRQRTDDLIRYAAEPRSIAALSPAGRSAADQPVSPAGRRRPTILVRVSYALANASLASAIPFALSL